MKKGLLIVDIQRDYFSGGKFELVGSDEALANAKTALSRFRDKGLSVFHVRHTNLREDATFLAAGTTGAEIHPALAPVGGEDIVTKHAPNAFYDTPLLGLLKGSGIDHLVVCGMMTHMCVDTTVRATKDYDFTVTLLGDACATRDLSWRGETVEADKVQKIFLASLDGIFARVIETAELEL